MSEHDTRKAADQLKERLQELSHKNLMDVAVERWTEERDARKKRHNPTRNR